MADVSIADARSDEDWAGIARLDSEAFGEKLEEARTWIEGIRPHVRARIARRDGALVGHYILLPFEQWFGGRCQPAAAVASVAVAVAARRTGVAAALLTDLPEQAREMGAAVSPLWAATTRLYRRHGWEVGGRSHRRRIAIRALARLRAEHGRLVDPISSDDAVTLARRVAPEYDAHIAPPAWWLDAPEFRAPVHRYRFGWEEEGELTGFVLAHQDPGDSDGLEIVVEAFTALTADATRGMLGAIGAMETMTERLIVRNAAAPQLDATLFLLDEPHRDVEVRTRITWMERITDLAAAVQRRGWAAGASDRVELLLRTPGSAPQLWILEFAPGTAYAEAGDTGVVETDLATLSGWYTGALTARHARRLGRLTGPDSAVATLDAALQRQELWLGADF